MQAHETLKEWRTEEGLTQAQAAERASKGGQVTVSQAMWSRVEAGAHCPSLSLAFILDALTGGRPPVGAWVPEAQRPKRPAPKTRSRRAKRAA